MKISTILLCLVILAIGTGALVYTYPDWSAWLTGPPADPSDDHHHQEKAERVRLSPQARKNLKLQTGKVTPVPEFWRTLLVPGTVVERPGHCDRLVTAPMPAVVKEVFAFRGDWLKPGAPLFTLQLVGEQLQGVQANLYKTQRELQIAQDEQQRLASVAQGAISPARLIELDNQGRRLRAALEALEHELAMRGLNTAQIKEIAGGKFQTELTIPVPRIAIKGSPLKVDPSFPAESANAPHSHEDGYDVEEVKVTLGQQVEAGQPLCLLANHHLLAIEGRVFETEAGDLFRAAKAGWRVQVEFPPDNERNWPTWNVDLPIVGVANKVDPRQNTLTFFLDLPNQQHEFTQGGKTYRLWRFRPNQRVSLRIPVEPLKDVFVLPAAAVVRDGTDYYVFRENGDFFDRLPVHVLFEDQKVAVLANDGSVVPGNHLAQSSAVQLNWALKAAGDGGGHHGHDHDH